MEFFCLLRYNFVSGSDCCEGWNDLCLARDAQLNVCACQPGSSCANLELTSAGKKGKKGAIVRFVVDARGASRSPSLRVSGASKESSSGAVANGSEALSANRQPIVDSTAAQKGSRGARQRPLATNVSEGPLVQGLAGGAACQGERWQMADGKGLTARTNPQRRFSLFHCSTSSTSLEGELLRAFSPPDGPA